MIILPQHKYFVFNTEMKPVELFIPLKSEEGIYEVLRIIEGIPLFLKDHIVRFLYSAELAGKTIPYAEGQIRTFLKKLIDANAMDFGNVMITFNGNLLIYCIPHKYPGPGMYDCGVACGILHAERENPNAKIFQTPVREQADKMLANKAYYEVLLVDSFGNISEGSRSNVFFVSGNELVTSPGKKVLLGITRQKTVQLARNLNIRVNEREIGFDELQHFDAAFITGTSPKILPIRKIDGFDFNPQNEIVRQLMKSYDELIDKYLS